MLESEAKTKWCPMYRSDETENWSGSNRLHARGTFGNEAACLGPRCACWVDTGYDDAAKERTGRCGLARW